MESHGIHGPFHVECSFFIGNSRITQIIIFFNYSTNFIFTREIGGDSPDLCVMVVNGVVIVGVTQLHQHM